MAKYGSHDDPNDETISLLSCLYELGNPPKHKKPCGSNNCPRCEYDEYEKMLKAHKEKVAKDQEEQDRKDFEAWKAAGRPKAK